MTSSERPGVYSDFEVSSSIVGRGSGGAVGIMAASSGSTGEVKLITSYVGAMSAFGADCNMTALIKLLFQNGAAEVYAYGLSGNDYSEAAKALMKQPEIRYMVCDSREETVHRLMLSAINSADEASKYRIAVAECGETECEALISRAAALNAERITLVSHHEEDGVPGSVAAAVCGVIAGQDDPAVPFSGAELSGLDAIGENFSDAELNLMVRGGVTVIETMSGKTGIVRAVTTRSKTDGVSDATWRELNTILIVDSVIPAIRDSLRAKFSRSKNNSQTRGAIRTQVIIELENKLHREIIDGYGDVTASASEADPTVCEVSFAFTVAHGLNRIELKAYITV